MLFAMLGNLQATSLACCLCWQFNNKMIKYELAEDIKKKISEISLKLEMDHVDLANVICLRSRGSGSQGTIARCHTISRIWQKALNTKAVYLIEVISERFDKMPEDEKIKTLIHELMHIPKSFGGGFIHHSQFTNLNRLYQKFCKADMQETLF